MVFAVEASFGRRLRVASAVIDDARRRQRRRRKRLTAAALGAVSLLAVLLVLHPWRSSPPSSTHAALARQSRASSAAAQTFVCGTRLPLQLVSIAGRPSVQPATVVVDARGRLTLTPADLPRTTVVRVCVVSHRATR